jgi:PST family polysaccharide transporter
MTTATTDHIACENPPESPVALRAESLATGVMFMLGMTVVQKLVGLVRNVLFCGLLADDQLGRWSLAFGFLLLMAPLAVAGLPGSFGRYVEFYRQRGQLRVFLRRTCFVSGVLGSVAVVLVFLAPRWFAWFIFRDAQQTHLVQLLGIALATAIAFNFSTELLTALRQVRVVSWMQFVNSLVFAVLGLALLYGTRMNEEAVIVAFIAGAVVAGMLGVLVLRSAWRESPGLNEPLPHRELWSKLLPFAGWVWVTNLLANLFDAGDRFMLVHFAPLEAGAADALVGQYHCSRVVPVLLIGIAGTLAGILLPHMSHDWEAGRRDAVSRRLNSCLKLLGLAFTAAAVLILLGSPILFGWVLHGKYDGGLAVLPLTLTYCAWFSLATIAQTYLWCAERAKVSSLALLIGLLGNLALNYLLVPRLGLLGAVLATAAANGVALVLIFEFSQRAGMKIDGGTWLASGLPLLACLGPWPAAAALIVVGWLAVRGSWFFTIDERQQVVSLMRQVIDKFRSAVSRSAPATT